MRRAISFAALGALAAVLAVAPLSGAGEEPEGKKKRTTKVQVQSSQFGDVLFDGKGFVLYMFTKDKKDKSRCHDACAKAWPPFIKKGKLEAGSGIDASALGTTKRKDGSKQVTYLGRPLYYYKHDDKPGQILCHDVAEFGGDWLVLQPDGEPAP